MVGQRRTGEAAVEAEIQPIVHFVALAPPKEALRVVEDAGAIAELDQFEEMVEGGAGEENGVGKIHDHRSGGVVADDHVAAEERRAARCVEKAGAARAGEAENPANDMGRAGGNVGDPGALAAAGGPARCRAGPGEIALAGLKNDPDLMDARRNASGRRGRAPARSGEAARCSGEGEVRGIRNGSNRKGAVVSRDTDAAGGHELTDDKTVRRDGLNRRGCGGRGASSRSGKSRSARNLGEMRGGRCGDYGERAVVAGDVDSRDGHGLARVKAVRGRGGDGD